MIIGYDPVAKEVIVDLENGTPPLSVHATSFLMKWYARDGIYYGQLQEGGTILKVFYLAIDGDVVVGDVHAIVASEAPGKWRIIIHPPDVA